jgi:glycine cleavage system transcriptional repressor
MSNRSLAAVTAIGNDRPGIVSAVTRVLFETGCNLEDATSTILSGHFSMVLVVRLAEGATPEEVEDRLQPVAEQLDLVIAARPEIDSAVEHPTHVVSVYGGDRPGIVFRVAEHLASIRVNITNLSSRVIGSDEQPVYALMLEVSAEAGATTGRLEAGLGGLEHELGVDITVNEIDPDIL